MTVLLEYIALNEYNNYSLKYPFVMITYTLSYVTRSDKTSLIALKVLS